MFKVILVSALVSCAFAADLVQVLQDGGQTTLISLVQKAGLANTLLSSNDITLFAPSNDAFARLGSRVLSHLDNNPSLLKDILLYHVTPHVAYAADLYNREHLRTLDAHHDTLTIHEFGSHVYVNNARVIKADTKAANGVVHVIDHVLIPLRHAGEAIFG